MKPEIDIIKAHDRMGGIIVDHEALFKTMPLEDQRVFTAALDVLCWVLDHEHNQTFARNQEKIKQWLEVHGLHFTGDNTQ